MFYILALKNIVGSDSNLEKKINISVIICFVTKLICTDIIIMIYHKYTVFTCVFFKVIFGDYCPVGKSEFTFGYLWQ